MKYKVIKMPARDVRHDDTRPRFYGHDSERLRVRLEEGLNGWKGTPEGYGFIDRVPGRWSTAYVVQRVPELDVEVLTGESAPKGSAAPLPAGIVAKGPPSPMSLDAGENPKARFGALKLPLHLVPPVLAQTAARNLGDGAVKYGPYNWRGTKVSASTYIGQMRRHLDAYQDGEDIDPESATGAPHLGGVAAGLAILLDAAAHGTLVDDRVKGPAAKNLRREHDAIKRRAAPDPTGGPARDKDEDDLIALLNEARQAAWQVQTGSFPAVTMRPMTRRERRIVHSVVQGYPELTTRSYGDGDYRRVRIERVLGKKVR